MVMRILQYTRLFRRSCPIAAHCTHLAVRAARARIRGDSVSAEQIVLDILTGALRARMANKVNQAKL